MYVAVTLEGIKKDRVAGMGVPNNRSHVRTSPVTISIHELFSKISPKDTDFLKYIPKQFFDNDGIGISERATRWAHNDAIETGTQRIFFYKNSPYLVEKYDSMDLGYLVEKKLTKKELNKLSRYIEIEDGEIENGGDIRVQQRGDGTFSNSQKNQEGIENTQGSGIYDYNSYKHSGETGKVQRLDSEQDGKRSFQHDRGRDNEYGFENSEDVKTNTTNEFEINREEVGDKPSSLNSSGVNLSVRKGSRAEKAQNAIANYEDTGNVADLPPRS